MSHDDAVPAAPAHVDRSAAERLTPDLIDAARADAATRVLVIHGDDAPMSDASRLLLVSPGDAPADAIWAFLGRAGDGTAVLTAVLSADGDEPFAAPAGWAPLRVIGADIDAGHAELFVEALSLGRWLLDSPYCPACGSATELGHGGWARLCPQCGREHFPRTDPAVIVAVASSGPPARLLLGSNALWGPDRYSCFAGFVEAGESLEAAVHREVGEEAGVRLSAVRYGGSQAWPYYRSLMLGFHAAAVDDGEARADGEEIATVRWFTRDEIGTALAGDSDVLLPGPTSIAHRLIVDWYEGSA